MRPARKGPENQLPLRTPQAGAKASMRPARKGPENRCACRQTTMAADRFNEAGPQGAGKPLPSPAPPSVVRAMLQ